MLLHDFSATDTGHVKDIHSVCSEVKSRVMFQKPIVAIFFRRSPDSSQVGGKLASL